MQRGPKSGFYYALAGFPILGAGIAGPDLLHASDDAKRAFFVVCVVVALVLVITGGITEARNEGKSPTAGRRRRMIAVIFMTVFGVGFIISLGVYLWPAVQPTGSGVLAGSAGVSSNKKDEPESVIFAECSYVAVPRSVPPDGQLTLVELRWIPQIPHQAGQVTRRNGNPGTQIVWALEYAFDQSAVVYRCDVRNYGTKPLFNLLFTLDVEFRAVVMNPEPNVSIGSGEVIGVATVNLDLARIDPGRDFPVSFYIYNMSPYWAAVKSPLKAVSGWTVATKGHDEHVITSPTVSISFPPLLVATASPPPSTPRSPTPRASRQGQ